MPGYLVKGNDPCEIFRVAGECIERARRGEGPSLIEIETSRLAGHFMGDAEGYRPKGELDALRARDPIPAMKARLMAEDGMKQEENDAIVARARAKGRLMTPSNLAVRARTLNPKRRWRKSSPDVAEPLGRRVKRAAFP